MTARCARTHTHTHPMVWSVISERGSLQPAAACSSSTRRTSSPQAAAASGVKSFPTQQPCFLRILSACLIGCSYIIWAYCSRIISSSLLILSYITFLHYIRVLYYYLTVLSYYIILFSYLIVSSYLLIFVFSHIILYYVRVLSSYLTLLCAPISAFRWSKQCSRTTFCFTVLLPEICDVPHSASWCWTQPILHLRHDYGKQCMHRLLRTCLFHLAFPQKPKVLSDPLGS